MKNIFLSVMFFLLFGISAGMSEAVTSDIMLTSPEKEGGMSLFRAIEERSSAAQKAFEEREPSHKELSTLIWAATGRNRNGKGWTVAFAMGSDPYISLYVLLKSGSYVYDPEKGDPDGGILPGTSFEEIPEDWLCPVCGVGKEDFEPIED